jgi:hypothetical protein
MKEILILAILFVSCSGVYQYKGYYAASLTEKEKNDIEGRIIFTDSLYKTDEMGPRHDYHEIDIKEKDTLIIYTKYFNLYRRSYYEKVDLIDESGKIFKQFDAIRHFPSSEFISWNCWNNVSVKKPEFHNGLVKVKAYLNNELIAEDSIVINIK